LSETVIWALHGFLGLPSDWKDFPVRAPAITPFPTLEAWASDFNQKVQQEAPGCRHVLMGYSMGGRLALHAYHQNPDMWSQVYLISTHPGLASGHEDRLAADEAWAKRFESDSWYPLVADWMAQKVFEKSRSPLRVESDFDRNHLAAYLRNYSLGRQKILLTDKVHWMVGERDPIYRTLLPHAEVIPDAGHRVIFDNPQAIHKICNPWRPG
jgi:2-succinyl-6-hydroxy-2,4-cyclohexadiene-1-carboxylate synthase